jgi:CelD/BcsL family acetyltransferase involved in cellulose biosynthesis
MATPLGLLAQPGRERAVAGAISQALDLAEPRPDLVVLSGTQLAERWPLAMRDGWPGRAKPVARAYRMRAYPRVSLRGGSLEAWLAGRSGKFRYAMRRLRRMLDEAGGSWRMSTEATVSRDIETFLRLHEARWEGRGQSTLVSSGHRGRAMLDDTARTLLAQERFRMWVMEIDGNPIAADIYLCGGGIAVGINCGWDERFKPLSPPLLGTMHAIEDAISRGERRVDLGPGDESHKTRFANDDSPVTWSVVMTPGARFVGTFALTAPMLANNAARDLAKRILKPEQVHTIRELRRRAHGSLPSRLGRSRTYP